LCTVPTCSSQGHRCDGKSRCPRARDPRLDSADTHHSANSFRLDPAARSTSKKARSTTRRSKHPTDRRSASPTRRLPLRAEDSEFEIYVTTPFANPHATSSIAGTDIVIDGTGAVPYPAALFFRLPPHPSSTRSRRKSYQQRTRPCPGWRSLPASTSARIRRQLLVGNVIGFQGILRYSSPMSAAACMARNSNDREFHRSELPPVRYEGWPDGAIYFIDWQNRSSATCSTTCAIPAGIGAWAHL